MSRIAIPERWSRTACAAAAYEAGAQAVFARGQEYAAWVMLTNTGNGSDAVRRGRYAMAQAIGALFCALQGKGTGPVVEDWMAESSMPSTAPPAVPFAWEGDPESAAAFNAGVAFGIQKSMASVQSAVQQREAKNDDSPYALGCTAMVKEMADWVDACGDTVTLDQPASNLPSQP